MIRWELEPSTWQRSADEYDPDERGVRSTERTGVVIEATRDDERWRGVRVRIVGTLERAHWQPDGSGPAAAPWHLVGVHRLEAECDDDTPTAVMFRDLGLGSLYRECSMEFSELARSDPQIFGMPSGFPKAGRKGEPPLYYALLVRDYLTAIDEFGPRGFMPHLLERQARGLARSSVLRNIDRAEELGLITARPGHGKAGGRMTAKCRKILAEAEQSRRQS